MKTIDEIRRENLSLLKDKMGGVGNLAEFLGRDASQISQWLNASAHSGTGKPRGMRSESCRYIEQKFGKPKGWMERDNGASAVAEGGEAISAIEASNLILLYGKANQEGRKAIMDLAKAVADLPGKNPL
jgi:hypothetical protein